LPGFVTIRNCDHPRPSERPDIHLVEIGRAHRCCGGHDAERLQGVYVLSPSTR
jgi:hypothetical protein